MSRSVNKVILIGNLGQDPETRHTGNSSVCNMRIATNESYKDSTGQLVEKTEWHSIVAWGRLAEICEQYLKKGSQAYFEGSLQTRQWQDRDGQTRYTTEVKAQTIVLLGGQGGQGGGRSYSEDDFDQSPAPRKAAPRQAYNNGGGAAPTPPNRESFNDAFGAGNDESNNMNDDLPF